jgi:hypothetical protein
MHHSLYIVLFVGCKRLGRLWNSVETEKVVCVWGTLLRNFDPVKWRVVSASND